ncbi:glycine cleavage system aminomethyltransferase GcvT [Parvibium lacunae]|uniref:aminomethyltransferase n=1 Tax=Parvibium lacunae TaxID=1888893 RepID=A0A368L4Y0_9BURK|nr:glycine cleavage system aminomethyltransferase GcvT [Parvibium lacunae]RCS58533.1 glycine cleavage system aminomethyltransferase GcvT [Parvibium lacunae]
MNSLLAADILRTTPLHTLHLNLGAKMVNFAGYEMPVQYPAGILKEHHHTRHAAGLFDVSHMGQIQLRPQPGATLESVALALETLLPIDVLGLQVMQQRYALFTNEQGGILDDLMVTRALDHFFLVVNAACKAADIEHLQTHLHGVEIEVLEEHALLALQGPQAAAVLARLCPDTPFQDWYFMTARVLTLAGESCFVTRSGYTGEDGFEISIPAPAAMALAMTLLAQPEVAPIGLGARDSLRLEAGLCLYGHDLSPETTPTSAALSWALSPARRANGSRPGGYPGAAVIMQELAQPTQIQEKRVGLLAQEKTPVREGTLLLNAQQEVIGRVTSGGVSPSLAETAGHAVPIALAYVQQPMASVGQTLYAQVRGKLVPMQVCKTPFVPQRYYRAP